MRPSIPPEITCAQCATIMDRLIPTILSCGHVICSGCFDMGPQPPVCPVCGKTATHHSQCKSIQQLAKRFSQRKPRKIIDNAYLHRLPRLHYLYASTSVLVGDDDSKPIYTHMLRIPGTKHSVCSVVYPYHLRNRDYMAVSLQLFPSNLPKILESYGAIRLKATLINRENPAASVCVDEVYSFPHGPSEGLFVPIGPRSNVFLPEQGYISSTSSPSVLFNISVLVESPSAELEHAWETGGVIREDNGGALPPPMPLLPQNNNNPAFPFLHGQIFGNPLSVGVFTGTVQKNDENIPVGSGDQSYRRVLPCGWPRPPLIVLEKLQTFQMRLFRARELPETVCLSQISTSVIEVLDAMASPETGNCVLANDTAIALLIRLLADAVEAGTIVTRDSAYEESEDGFSSSSTSGDNWNLRSHLNSFLHQSGQLGSEENGETVDPSIMWSGSIGDSSEASLRRRAAAAFQEGNPFLTDPEADSPADTETHNEFESEFPMELVSQSSDEATPSSNQHALINVHNDISAPTDYNMSGEDEFDLRLDDDDDDDYDTRFAQDGTFSMSGGFYHEAMTSVSPREHPPKGPLFTSVSEAIFEDRVARRLFPTLARWCHRYRVSGGWECVKPIIGASTVSALMVMTEGIVNLEALTTAQKAPVGENKQQDRQPSQEMPSDMKNSVKLGSSETHSVTIQGKRNVEHRTNKQPNGFGVTSSVKPLIAPLIPQSSPPSAHNTANTPSSTLTGSLPTGTIRGLDPNTFESSPILSHANPQAFLTLSSESFGVKNSDVFVLPSILSHDNHIGHRNFQKRKKTDAQCSEVQTSNSLLHGAQFQLALDIADDKHKTVQRELEDRLKAAEGAKVVAEHKNIQAQRRIQELTERETVNRASSEVEKNVAITDHQAALRAEQQMAAAASMERDRYKTDLEEALIELTRRNERIASLEKTMGLYKDRASLAERETDMLKVMLDSTRTKLEETHNRVLVMCEHFKNSSSIDTEVALTSLDIFKREGSHIANIISEMYSSQLSGDDHAKQPDMTVALGVHNPLVIVLVPTVDVISQMRRGPRNPALSRIAGFTASGITHLFRNGGIDFRYAERIFSQEMAILVWE